MEGGCQPAGFGLVFSLYLGIMAGLPMIGGTRAILVIPLLYLPMLAVFFLGKRTALLFASLSILYIAILELAQHQGLITPPPARLEKAQVRTVVFFFLHIFPLGIAWLFESNREVSEKASVDGDDRR